MARSIRDTLRRLSGDHSPSLAPWFPASRGTAPVDELHRRALELERAAAHGATDRALLALRAALWPVVSVIHAASRLRAHGARVRQAHGLGLLSQFTQMVALANRHNLDADAYYSYEIFRAERRDWPARLIHDFEIALVLQHALPRMAVNDLDPKDAFYHRCQRAGIPTAPVTAFFAGGEFEAWTEPGRSALPRVDLIVKPCNGSGGVGVESWRYDERTDGWRRQGVELDEAALLRRCRELSTTDRILVQPRLVNDPALAAISSGALATARVVTCFPVGGQPVEIGAGLRMPVGTTDVDNASAGGIFSTIDPVTGRLGVARAMDPRRGTFTHHPDTGAPVEGVEMPAFRQFLQVCVDAHAKFPEFRTIGWDVAVTTQGPILVEGNSIWSVQGHQIVTGRALGDTVASTCLLQSLDPAPPVPA